MAVYSVEGYRIHACLAWIFLDSMIVIADEGSRTELSLEKERPPRMDLG